jgi:hypothetical protein
VTPLITLFDSKASFELAALCISWIAVVLLALAIANLHARLRQLELAVPVPGRGRPYGHLLGKPIHDLLHHLVPKPPPQVLIFLSTNCRACNRVLSELASPSWTVPSAIVWTDHTPHPPPPLPSNTVIIEQGAKLSADLGIRVTPFVLVASADGRIVKASPMNTLSAVGDLVSRSVDFHYVHLPHDPLKEHSHEL